MRITSGGNVGIGTTSPTAPLQIYKSGLSDNSSNALLNIHGKFTAASVDSSDIVGISFTVENSGGGTQTSQAISFAYNNILSLMKDGGSVGIGTTSPSYLLQVNGTGYYNSNLTVNGTLNMVANNSYINIDRSSTAADGLIIYKTANSNRWLLGAWGNTNNTFYLYSYGTGGSVFNVDYSTGNVGIGTTSPGDKLTVSDGSSYFHIRGNAAGDFQAPALAPHIATGDFTIYAGTIGSGTDRMVVKNGGNVGIGTTSPLAQLDIKSTVTNTSAPTIFVSQVDGASQSYGQISTGDIYHGLILRGIPTNNTNYGVTAGNQMSFFEYGDDFRFYKKDVSSLALQGRLNSGTWTVTGDVVAYGSPSDITLKTNIKPLEGALDKITKLQGVSFTWKDDVEINQMTGIKDDLGFIAQQVQEVLPELVRKNDNGLLSLRDKGITALLVEAIKEQQRQIEDLKYLLSQK